MRTRLLTLGICFFSSILIVTIVFRISKYKTNHPNGFYRLIPPHKVNYKSRFDIKYNSWNLLGEYNGNIFLSNSVALNKLLTINFQLNDTSARMMVWPDSVRIHYGAKIKIDSSSVYMMDGSQPIILKGKLSDLKLNSVLKVPYFTAAIPISSNSVLFRSVNEHWVNFLQKKCLDVENLTPASGVLQKQVDGIFCTDGTIIKIPGSPLFFYTYYYRNQFICLDTNLNVLYRGKTIDTISHAHIKVGIISSSHQATMEAPPLFVNKEVCANKDWLFVHSALIADNEDDKSFDEVSVIDVYAVNDGKYQFSFYLPGFRGHFMKDMMIIRDCLYVLIDHYIYQFKLNF